MVDFLKKGCNFMNTFCFKKLNVLMVMVLCTSMFVPPLLAEATVQATVLSESDNQLLNEVEKRALEYFVRERNPENGLVRDWAWNQSGNSSAPASVAATGFALTAYGVGAQRGWLKREEAIKMTKTALIFLKDGSVQEHGFFYHFMTMDTGRPINGSEVSPIDTALAVSGILFAAHYYDDPEIKRLAGDIVSRVDWTWMLNGGNTFALAWSPERGFFKGRWSNFDESILLYILALGSSTHPIPAEAWRAVKKRVGSYGDHKVIQSPPLFTHQYPHIWIDFRDKNDGFADYFANSKQATLAQRQFAIDQSSKFKSYGPDSWGFTAAEGPFGYKAYGGPPGWATHDGTIAPTACVSSIAFTPDESISCIRHFRQAYGHKLWGRYGFSDSFNIDQNWFSNKAFAINQGPMILMIENFRSELIWKIMNQAPEISNGLQKAGFQAGSIPLRWERRPELNILFVGKPLTIDGKLEDWPEPAAKITLDENMVENGMVTDKQDLSAFFRFGWDKEFLYFAADINDDSFVALRNKGDIWRDDLVEFFIDPAGDGLNWGKPSDFQIGFRLAPEEKKVRTWSWFQGGQDPSQADDVRANGFATPQGYMIEGAIRWAYLKVKAVSGTQVHLSVAVHDFDRDRSEGKIHWFFRNEKELNRYELGQLNLMSASKSTAVSERKKAQDALPGK
jgi:hypothetical protein